MGPARFRDERFRGGLPRSIIPGGKAPGTLGLNLDLRLWRCGVEALASAIGNVAVGGAVPNHSWGHRC